MLANRCQRLFLAFFYHFFEHFRSIFRVLLASASQRQLLLASASCRQHPLAVFLHFLSINQRLFAFSAPFRTFSQHLSHCVSISQLMLMLTDANANPLSLSQAKIEKKSSKICRKIVEKFRKKKKIQKITKKNHEKIVKKIVKIKKKRENVVKNR